MDYTKIYVCGHRNPDVDSITSAYALAELRKRTGVGAEVEAICPGRLPERAKWVFAHFGLTPPRTKNDVYMRVRHMISAEVPMIPSDIPLIYALKTLEASGESSLPVRAEDGKFLGMLSPAKLLNLFIAKSDLKMPVREAPLHACSQVLCENDPVHDIKSGALKNPHNHFPVVDDHGKLLGTVLKRAFAEPPPYRMILVDHNETEQGIPGLEEIPVLEVVDHHRISFASTSEPIRYTADIVGSTCTIVSRMFRGAGERPSKAVAGVMLAGIIADTLNFQSPTTSETDRQMAAWLEKLCGETGQSLMDGMMSVGSALATMTADRAIDSDRKIYKEGGFSFSLSQIEESNLALFHTHRVALEGVLDSLITGEKLDFAALLVTDPVRGNSELLFRGNEAVRRALPYRRDTDGIFALPGVLSRKKQLLPQIIASLPA